MSKEPNYYRILGITPLADDQEIKRAYRMLVKRYHPDVVPPDRREWAREQMTRINAAYQVLQDPQRRAKYDRQHGYLRLSEKQPASPADVPVMPALRRRARERHRRETLTRWHGAALLCALLFTLGLILTPVLARTTTALVVATVIDGLLFLALIFSLSMLNR